MNTQADTPHDILPTQLPAPEEKSSRNFWKQAGWTAAAVIVVGLLITGVVLLLQAPEDTTAKVRDVFIIFMALEFLVTGLALVILIVQLARLIQLLQHEVKPILESTHETANTLRGTTRFLSDHLVEPVMKLNEYLAGIQSFFRFFRPKE